MAEDDVVEYREKKESKLNSRDKWRAVDLRVKLSPASQERRGSESSGSIEPRSFVPCALTVSRQV